MKLQELLSEAKYESAAPNFLAAALKLQSAYTAKMTEPLFHGNEYGETTQVHFYVVPGTDPKEVTKARAKLKKLALELDAKSGAVVTPGRFWITFRNPRYDVDD